MRCGLCTGCQVCPDAGIIGVTVTSAAEQMAALTEASYIGSAGYQTGGLGAADHHRRLAAHQSSEVRLAGQPLTSLPRQVWVADGHSGHSPQGLR